jgi:hypothetical protein
MSNELVEFQSWYASQCDGDWEHGKGIEIGTLDNPGWSVRINLEDTELEERAFAAVEENYEDEREWLRCWVAEKQFHAAGGPFQLQRMLRIFLDWAGIPNSSAVAPAG